MLASNFNRDGPEHARPNDGQSGQIPAGGVKPKEGGLGHPLDSYHNFNPLTTDFSRQQRKKMKAADPR